MICNEEHDELIRIANDDEIAFRTFMLRHSAHLYHYVYGLISDKESAEEIVSDVFFDVWNIRKSLNEINSIKAWMLTVAYRNVVSHWRKSRMKTVSFHEIEDFEVPSLHLPDNDIISSEEAATINNAIENLPAKCKHVFYLAKIEQLPYKEIAGMLNISVNTINNHLAKALCIISEKLKKSDTGKARL